jgi:hypothetical protein
MCGSDFSRRSRDGVGLELSGHLFHLESKFAWTIFAARILVHLRIH